MRKTLAILFLVHATPVLAGWSSEVNPRHLVSPGLVHIAYSPDPEHGSPTFKAALDRLAEDGQVDRLELITLHRLVEIADFQKELMAVVQEISPKELSDALNATANMHDQKMVQLRRPFEAAVLSTPTVKTIDAELSRYGLQVSGASTEKLSLVKRNGVRHVMCFLWLQVSPR